MSSTSFPLHEAIQNGESIASLKEILSQNPTKHGDPSEPDSRGISPVHCLAGARACLKRVEVLNLLIDHYKSRGYTQEQVLDTRDKNGNTVYHLAAKYKRYHLIKRLVELEADPFAENNAQWLPVHYAADVGSRLIKLLTNMLDQNPNLSGKVYSPSVLTPVQVAAKHCALEALKKFRERKFSFRPHAGQSLLNLVIQSTDSVGGGGADRDSEDGAVKCLEYLLSIGVQSLKPDVSDSATTVKTATMTVAREVPPALTPIHIAAQRRNPKILESLLENQWNAIDELIVHHKESPLHILARANKKSAAECAQILLNPYYHKNQLENVIEFSEMTDAHGNTALDICCEEENSLVAEVILSCTYDIEAADNARVYWLDGQVLHKIYSRIPMALVPVLDMSLEQQTYRHAELEEDLAMQYDYTLITGLELDDDDDVEEPTVTTKDTDDEKGTSTRATSVKAILHGRPVDEFWTESSHLHEIVDRDRSTRTQILRHPLVQQYLTETWRKYAFLSYFCAIVQILILASYVVFVAVCNCPETQEQRANISSIHPDSSSSCGQHAHDSMCFISTIIATVLTGSLLIKECFQLATAPKLRFYLLNKYNMAQMCFGILAVASIVLVFTGSTTEEDSDSDSALRLVSVFGLVAVWFVAILQLQNLPPFGIYISIFGQVSKKSLKILLIFGLPTFCVFSVIFRLLITKPAFQPHSSGSGTLGTIVKLFILMMGELSFDETFYDNGDAKAAGIDGESVITLLMFTMFAFIATIVILNLLLAIAVDISQEVYSNAEMELAKCQLEQIYLWETLNPRLKSVCDIMSKRLHLV